MQFPRKLRAPLQFLLLLLLLHPATLFGDRYGLMDDYTSGEGSTLGTLLIGALIGAFVYEIWIHRK